MVSAGSEVGLQVPSSASSVDSYDARVAAGTVNTICPCDLTLNACDYNCCCDTTDCSSAAIATFSYCVPYANTSDRWPPSAERLLLSGGATGRTPASPMTQWYTTTREAIWR